ncbi:DNA repair protein RecO [Corynebacterium sp. H113]|uniref:DNA repair protein RecO n=1 Tax=Corynebacterium sp. H113 TaxID=3133419 RepID=UPI0030AC490D
MAEPFRDRAIVVRRHDLGEADRIIVLFTREHGLVRAVAKGVRRAKSRFGSRLSPFVEIDALIYPGRNLGTINSVDTIRTWAAPLVDDYARYTCACAVLEVAERLVLEPDPQLWDMTVGALDNVTTYTPGLALTSYILQAMQHTGWAPSLFECANCGKAGPHHAFSPALGGAVCTNCRPPGTGVDTEVLRLMWHLSRGDLSTTDAHVGSRARALATAHLEFHLGRRITALKLVDAQW